MPDWRWVMDHRQPLRIIPHRMPADCWNAVRLALRRRGATLRFEVLGGVQCELRDPAWLVWAALPAECPLLLWTDFERCRAALDAPVDCRLYLYHVHAGRVLGRLLDAIRDKVRAPH